MFGVKQMSNVFCARFVEQLRLMLKEKTVDGAFPAGLFDKDRVVFAKLPFGGPKW